MTKNGEMIWADDDERSRGGGSGGEKRRRRSRCPSRRPLHPNYRAASSISCLLLATSASSSLAAGKEDHRRRRPRTSLRSINGVSDHVGGIGSGIVVVSSGGQPHLRDNNRHLAGAASNIKFCPPNYTGQAPTAKCAGYVSCTDGKQTSSVQSCASGTMFDTKSGSCTWPDSVNCKWGKDLEVEGAAGDDGKGGAGDQSKFCPERYTGRAPTSNCGGYVQCTKGTEGLSVKCPPRTLFSTMTNLCEYNLDEDDCQMLVGESPSTTKNGLDVNELDKYCPDDYTGRAPIMDCEGYVDCKDGKARRSKMCPGDTKFDAMILACTYSNSGCEALAENGPTPSPVTKAEARASALVVGCPEDHTGYITLPGCEEYLYCVAGKEISKFDCADGTLYNGSYCTWSDQVDCDTTRVPTEQPTETPTDGPTGGPTFYPTEFDMDGDVYYPNFTDGTCLNDGNYPSNVGRQYLFNNAAACCHKYFQNNLDNCLKATVPTPAPTPTAGKEWYPDYDSGICRNDVLAGAFETNFFFTFEECCHFDWIRDPIVCLRNKPVVAYYPDYDTNTCRNDGRQSPFEDNLFDSLEECCKFDWIDYAICITKGDDGGEEVPVPKNEITGFKFYPDYTHNVCHCDGKQSKYETNIFGSYNECCNFDLVDTNICKQYKIYQEAKCVESDASAPKPTPRPTKKKPGPADANDEEPTENPTWSPTYVPTSSPATASPTELDVENSVVYYPSFATGVCLNDGKYPPKIGREYLFPSAQSCCKAYFSGNMKKCTAATAPTPAPTPKGGKKWYPDYVAGICKDDGLAGNWETNFFWTREECCKFEWIRDEVKCLWNSKPIEEVGAGVEFYPDYKNNVCHCDGSQSKFEVNIFSTYEACCQFSLIDTDVCRKSKTTQEATCVESPSGGQASSGGSSCKGLTNRQCMKDPLCKFEGGQCVSVSTMSPTRSPTRKAVPSTSRCSSLNNRQCAKDPQCQVDGNSGQCMGVSGPDSIDTKPPTHSPTRKASDMCNELNGRQCTKDPQCRVDSNGQCVGVSGPDRVNTKPPTPSPSRKASDMCTGLNNRQCVKDPQCRVDGNGQCVGVSGPDRIKTKPPTQSPTRKVPDMCAGLNNRQCVKDPQCQLVEGGQCVGVSGPDRIDTKPPTQSPTRHVSSSHCTKLNNRQCVKDPQCQLLEGGECAGVPGDSASGNDDAALQTPNLCSENINKKSCLNEQRALCKYDYENDKCLPVEKEKLLEMVSLLTGTGGSVEDEEENKYYPDYFNGVCLNDGKQAGDATKYDDIYTCCRDPWLVYKTCIKKSGTAALELSDVSGVYYPDPNASWEVGTCINVSPMPNNVGQGYPTMLECCKGAFGGQMSGACLSKQSNMRPQMQQLSGESTPESKTDIHNVGGTGVNVMGYVSGAQVHTGRDT